MLYAWFNYPGRLLEHQFGYGVVYQRSVIVSVNEHLIIVYCFVAIFIRSSVCVTFRVIFCINVVFGLPLCKSYPFSDE